MANLIYNGFKKKIQDGSINLSSDTIKIMLVTSSYSPDIDAHVFKDAVTNEITGAGYTAGGATLANKTVTQDNTNNKGVFDADDPAWSSSTITARGAVIYKDTGVAGTSPLICYIDFGADKVSTAGTFAIVFDSAGILALA